MRVMKCDVGESVTSAGCGLPSGDPALHKIYVADKIQVELSASMNNEGMTEDL